MLLLQLYGVLHCKYGPLSYLFIKMLAVSWFVLFKSNPHFHSSLSHEHTFMLPHHSHHRGETVLTKHPQSLQQLFWLSFKSQPHQLNSYRDSNHIRSIRTSSDPDLVPAMSSVCSTDQSSAHPSYPNFRDMSVPAQALKGNLKVNKGEAVTEISRQSLPVS